jgi:hypothetical protein
MLWAGQKGAGHKRPAKGERPKGAKNGAKKSEFDRICLGN